MQVKDGYGGGLLKSVLNWMTGDTSGKVVANTDGSFTVSAGKKSRVFSNRSELEKYVEGSKGVIAVGDPLVSETQMRTAAAKFLEGTKEQETWTAGAASGVIERPLGFGSYKATRNEDGSLTISAGGGQHTFKDAQELQVFAKSHPHRVLGTPIGHSSPDDVIADAARDYLDASDRLGSPNTSSPGMVQDIQKARRSTTRP
jgi:hypothetical protein